MAKIEFGRLSGAWKGEASDFTPLLAAQLDALGDQICVDLISIGQSEVSTAGGRRIDIVAQSGDGLELVVENQYGRADHDHLTRGLAYAVARHARGLIVVAEEHRDEFRAVAEYLNDLAELDREHGIKIWLVEAKAIRIADGPWAPLFSTVVQPNSFTATVEVAKQSELTGTLDDFWQRYDSEDFRAAAKSVLARWTAAGFRHRVGPGANSLVLMATGPSVGGQRNVAAIYPDGRVHVPFRQLRRPEQRYPYRRIDDRHLPDRRQRAVRIRRDRKAGPNGTGLASLRHQRTVLCLLLRGWYGLRRCQTVHRD